MRIAEKMLSLAENQVKTLLLWFTMLGSLNCQVPRKQYKYTFRQTHFHYLTTLVTYSFRWSRISKFWLDIILKQNEQFFVRHAYPNQPYEIFSFEKCFSVQINVEKERTLNNYFCEADQLKKKHFLYVCFVEESFVDN